jgi:hypothetical protein
MRGIYFPLFLVSHNKKQNASPDESTVLVMRMHAGAKQERRGVGFGDDGRPTSTWYRYRPVAPHQPKRRTLKC